MRPLRRLSAALVLTVAAGAGTATLATFATGCSSHRRHFVPTPANEVGHVPFCRAPERPSGATAIALVDAFPMLPAINAPVGMTQAPGDAAHFYVWEQSGQIVRFDAANPTATSTVLDLAAVANKLKFGDGEDGLLGLAFSPKWQTDHTAYLSYNTPSAAPAGFDSVLSRIKSSDGGATFDLATEQVILQFGQPFTNHNGGNILFGPDGYLYAGFGDGGSGYDPGNRSQDLTLFFGKMLRLDVDGQATYAIPPDNPFANDATGKKKEIYAYGLRNPWRWSFDRDTGQLWVGDVGQDRWEEVDQLALGGNYGWKVMEGTHCTDNTTTCSLPGALPPVLDYGHPSTGDPQPGNSITGGYVYRGKQVPTLAGSYLFADFTSGRLWRIVYDADGKAQRDELLETGKNISSFAEDLDGELYVLSYGEGRIFKIVAGSNQPGTNFPERLSATGCVDPQDPSVPAANVVPYDVNVPLWSDGAAKRRWVSIPAGAQIHVNDDGDWDLPIGSVLMKEFAVDGQRVETRLLVRHADGDWAGYSYEWLPDQSDAVLLPGSKTKDLGNGKSWYYPSRNDCLQCHTAAAGRTLGLETAQLNRDGDGVGNQLDLFAAMGWLDAPLPSPPAMMPKYPAPDDQAAPLDQRARAYLHANCSFCHRMGGTGRVPPDWRFGLTLMQTGACNAQPEDGDLGIAGATVLTPGSPATSLASVRMHALDASRMPPLASHVVDPDGTALVDAWIGSLTGCN